MQTGNASPNAAGFLSAGQIRYNSYMLDRKTVEQWRRIGIGRRSGVLAPLFALYSRDSKGIGDSEDLKLMVDWCAKTGNSILQLLPMNEVGDNFCPYESISSFALEPMYLAMGRGRYPIVAGHAPAQPPTGITNVDYRIKSEKINILHEAYLRGGEKSRQEIERFKEKNSRWVEDFALFKVLKHRFGGKPWYLWPDEYKDRSEKAINSFYEKHADDIGFEIWLQSLLYKQFSEVKDYAAGNGVLLMGDMPIAMSRDSADVWSRREFFNLGVAAGAPPDMFCSKGQRWGNPGMPTYNWEKIAADCYRHIKEKLQYASNFYDIMRIDHIAGLFRIWSIPLEEPVENAGMNGFFDPPDESLWEKRGREILSIMLESSKMLLCGEDLGIVPEVCTKTMESLYVPGIDVQRWMKNWQGTKDFLPPEQYRFLSASALSTHDTANWKAWWEHESYREEKELFWKYLEIPGKAQEKVSRETMEAALRFILKTPCVFSVQLIFDWLNLPGDILAGEKSKIRINTPGTVNSSNWSAVLPLSLEELLDHGICGDMRTLIENSGRL